jgi:hypothetical protein
MTNDYSIPPLRDLPPGRLAQRAEHLHAEITSRRQTRLVLPRVAMPRLQLAPPFVVALIAAIAALALVPIGGASLATRAINGISGIWTSGSPPPAPAPYQQGDKVLTTTPPAPTSSEFNPPAGYIAPQPPPAPPTRQQGDKVWKTTPATGAQTTTTITCATPDDAASLLAKLEKEGSPITSVECR